MQFSATRDNAFRDRTRTTGRVESEARPYARPLGRERPPVDGPSERVPKVLFWLHPQSRITDRTRKTVNYWCGFRVFVLRGLAGAYVGAETAE